jgi:hypothetical protein
LTDVKLTSFSSSPDRAGDVGFCGDFSDFAGDFLAFPPLPQSQMLLALVVMAMIAALENFPNIDYLHAGYNIIKGNPAAEGTDPGFTAALQKNSNLQVRRFPPTHQPPQLIVCYEVH